METFFKIGLSILFLSCLLDMPYGYYQFVRFLGTIGFGFLAYQSKKRNEGLFFVFWVVSAVLVNPILKISLGRILWNFVDITWAIILLINVKRSNND